MSTRRRIVRDLAVGLAVLFTIGLFLTWLAELPPPAGGQVHHTVNK